MARWSAIDACIVPVVEQMIGSEGFIGNRHDLIQNAAPCHDL